jgi:hypothetical protein
MGNTNNRFQVANDLNTKCGASEGPFWGHPPGQTYPQLRATGPSYPIRGLSRLRQPIGTAPNLFGSCGAMVVWVAKLCSGFQSSRACAKSFTRLRVYGRSKPAANYRHVAMERESFSPNLPVPCTAA